MVFGMIVIDEQDRLVGMLSMYDILLFVQSRHASVWSELEDLDQTGMFSDLVGRVKYIQVGDLMTPEVVTVEPDTHLMVIVDVMIKRHIRRLPVVSGGDVVGIVYISVSIQK
jgi:CBS domain-containing protein